MWEKQTIQSQIKNSALDNVSFLQNNMENEIENIKLLQNNLSNDITLNELVTQYSNLPTYEYYTLITDVQQRLKVMKNSNNYIEDVIVYILGMGKTISAKDGYSNFDNTEYSRLFQIQLNAKYPLIIDSSEIYATSLYPFIVKKEEAPLYLVKVMLSESSIKNFLGKFSKYNASNTALYDCTSGDWIFNAQSSLGSVNDAKLDLIAKTSGKNQDFIASISGKKYYVLSTYSKYLNASFVQYVPLEDIFSVPDRYGNFLWIYAAISIIIMLLYSFSTYRFVKYPINTLLKSFRRLESGDMGARVQLKAANEFNDLFEGFNKMVFRLNELIDRVYRQELYAKKSELKQLQSQINPHFLYNSYFMLHRLIKHRDLENAELLSSYLGKYLQYITRNALEEVPLQNELVHARSYAQIQQMRFSRWLSVEFGEIPEKFREFMVPYLILQPILENSFEHGLKSTMKNGLIRIGFEDIGTGLLISIEDSGNDLQDSDIEILQRKLLITGDGMEITGIINVHKRIALKYGPGSGITVSRSALGGLRVEIRIFPESMVE